MKKILILGNNNAVTYKNVFPLIKEGKLRLGWNSPKEFANTDKKVATYWFTNMKTGKKKILKATELYDAKKYPKFDNYDAINCGRLKDFPADYDGVIGVPITILEYVDDDGYINVEYDD